jgi:hypothetical protein
MVALQPSRGPVRPARKERQDSPGPMLDEAASTHLAGAARPLPCDGRQSRTALAVALGARRLLASHGFSSVTELTLASGRRADIVGLGPSGDVWILEVKSSVPDFRADRKWPGYRDFCDRFFFAVPSDFPHELLPENAGVVLADSFGAAILRGAPAHRLAGARRKAVMLRFAHLAAARLHTLADPHAAAGHMD